MRESFDNLPTWFEMLELECGQSCRKYVVANKIDLDPKSPLIEEAKKFCEERKCPFFATTAKDHSMVLSLFQAVASDLSNEIDTARRSEAIQLSNTNAKKNKCCG